MYRTSAANGAASASSESTLRVGSTQQFSRVGLRGWRERVRVCDRGVSAPSRPQPKRAPSSADDYGRAVAETLARFGSVDVVLSPRRPRSGNGVFQYVTRATLDVSNLRDRGWSRGRYGRSRGGRLRAPAGDLYGIVRTHRAEFLGAVDAGTDGGGLPGFIVNEFRKFLRCGVLSHGFARVRCGDCAVERLVPVSCKGRPVCPSCGGRTEPRISSARRWSCCSGSCLVPRPRINLLLYHGLCCAEHKPCYAERSIMRSPPSREASSLGWLWR
ncbi:MAG: transposase zinc-binding domain-containing protein [Longimicrobiales bacterium]